MIKEAGLPDGQSLADAVAASINNGRWEADTDAIRRKKDVDHEALIAKEFLSDEVWKKVGDDLLYSDPGEAARKAYDIFPGLRSEFASELRGENIPYSVTLAERIEGFGIEILVDATGQTLEELKRDIFNKEIYGIHRPSFQDELIRQYEQRFLVAQLIVQLPN